MAELIETRMRRLSARAQEIVRGADQAGRDLEDAESRELDEVIAEHERLRGDEDRRDRVGAMARDHAGTGRKFLPPTDTDADPFSLVPPPSQRARVNPQRFAQLFPGTRAERTSFRDMGEFFSAAMLNPLDRRFMNASMTEEVGSDGGFGVPGQFWGNLLDASLEQEAIRPLCTTIPMTGMAVDVPAWDLTDHTGNKRANLQMVFAGEGSGGTNQKGKLRTMNLKATKGMVPVAVSREAAEDIPMFERRITGIMIGALAAGFDYYFINGTGVGMPLGVLNSPCLVSVAKDSAQVADTLTVSNLTNMAAALHPASWRNASWLCSPTALAQLITLSQTPGPTDGSRAALLRQDGNTLNLFTRPLIVTEACAPIGDVGDIILGDFTKYLVGLRKEATLETSIHAGWSTDELYLRIVTRFAGQPELNAPVTLRDGATQVSSFVTLDAR